MTISDFQRGFLVEFAIRQAGPGASLDTMLGICYVMRNRVRKGWHDGNWIRAIEHADETAAHDDDPQFHAEIDPNHREFQMMLRQVDDIFFGSAVGGWGMESSDGPRLEESLMVKGHEKLYWMWMGRPVRPWFKENILDDSKNHKGRTHLGLMMFIE